MPFMSPTITIHMLACFILHLRAHRIMPNWSFHLIPFQSHSMKIFKEGTVLLQNKRYLLTPFPYVSQQTCFFHLLWCILKENFHQSSQTNTCPCFSKGVSPKFYGHVKKSTVLLSVSIHSTINWPSSFKLLGHQY